MPSVIITPLVPRRFSETRCLPSEVLTFLERGTREERMTPAHTVDLILLISLGAAFGACSDIGRIGVG